MARRQVVDTEGWAKEIREKFQAKPVERKVKLDFEWPEEMLYIGQAKAEMYRSNKWQQDPKKYVAYKHVAESWQDCYLNPSVKVYDENGEPISFGGHMEEVNGPLPKHIAYLAPSIGVQIHDSKGRLHQIEIANSHWGAAKHPDTGETFLVLYDKERVCLVMTGDELDVLKDGIVG